MPFIRNQLKYIREKLVNNTYLLNYILTYLLTPCSRVLLEKLTGSQLVKKFPTFYGTRKFITAFKNEHHLSLSWASLMQSMLPHSTFWRSILILSSHLCLVLLSYLFPLCFPTKTLYTPLLLYMLHSPAHLSVLDLITRTIFGEQYGSLSSSLCSFLFSPLTSTLLGPNILKQQVIQYNNWDYMPLFMYSFSQSCNILIFEYMSNRNVLKCIMSER